MYGELWEKKTVFEMLANCRNNNHLMWELSSHKGMHGKSVVEIMHEAHLEVKANFRNINEHERTLALLGHPAHAGLWEGEYDGRFEWDHENDKPSERALNHPMNVKWTLPGKWGDQEVKDKMAEAMRVPWF